MSVISVNVSGERESECRVKIINDKIRETEESFRLVLGTPDSITANGGTIGGQNTARVLILDPEDSELKNSLTFF